MNTPTQKAIWDCFTALVLTGFCLSLLSLLLFPLYGLYSEWREAKKAEKVGQLDAKTSTYNDCKVILRR